MQQEQILLNQHVKLSNHIISVKFLLCLSVWIDLLSGEWRKEIVDAFLSKEKLFLEKWKTSVLELAL